MVATRRSKRKTAPAIGSQNQSKDATPSAQKRSKKQKEETPQELKVGDACPEFTLETDEDKEVTLKDLIASQPIIIFMYPRANTPGCTKQACGFRDNYSAITKNGYGVYGLSGDKPIAQRTWKSKQQYQYNFLCDVDHKFMKALGVSSGKKITRSHVIVGTDGNLLDIQIGISPEKSVSEAIDYAKNNPHSSENQQGDAPAPQEDAEMEEPAAEKGGKEGGAAEDATSELPTEIATETVANGDTDSKKADAKATPKKDEAKPAGGAKNVKEAKADADAGPTPAEQAGENDKVEGGQEVEQPAATAT